MTTCRKMSPPGFLEMIILQFSSRMMLYNGCNSPRPRGVASKRKRFFSSVWFTWKWKSVRWTCRTPRREWSKLHFGRKNEFFSLLVEKRCYIFVTKKSVPGHKCPRPLFSDYSPSKKMSGFSTKVEFSSVFSTLDNTLSSREWNKRSGLLHPLGGAAIYYARDEDSCLQ